MDTILFVLLITTTTSSALSWSDTTLPAQYANEYEDSESTEIHDMDSRFPVAASRKVAIFFSRRALDAYLQSVDVGSGAILIDVKKGTQHAVKQAEVREIVMEPVEKRTGFTFTLEAEKER